MSDFEIEISGAAGSYRVAARSAAGETGAVPVRFPFDDLALDRQLQALELALLRSSATVRRLTAVEERPVQEFGRQLFEFVFPPELRAHLATSRQQAAQQGIPLRVRLRVGPAELAALPWEFLYDPSRDDYLCLSVPLVRYLDVLEPRRPLTVTPPLRILAMITRSDELDSLDVDHERRRLTEALADLQAAGRVQLSWVRGQTWWDLQEALDSGAWHVFHFIGHGGFESQTGEGVLAFAAEGGGVHRLGANDLALLLAEHRSLRLVVLSSCDTARASATDRFSSTASTLMRRGIPAVVAMQYEITDQAAISFARGFYTALAAQHPVDQAVTRARRAIKNTRRSTLEWATPVLYLRSPTGALFDLTDVSTISAPPPPAADLEQPSAPAKTASPKPLPLLTDATQSKAPVQGSTGGLAPPPQLPPPMRQQRLNTTAPPRAQQGGANPGSTEESPEIPRFTPPAYMSQGPSSQVGAPTSRQEQPGPVSKPKMPRTLWLMLIWSVTVVLGIFSIASIGVLIGSTHESLGASIFGALFFSLPFAGSVLILIRDWKKNRRSSD